MSVGTNVLISGQHAEGVKQKLPPQLENRSCGVTSGTIHFRTPHQESIDVCAGKELPNLRTIPIRGAQLKNGRAAMQTSHFSRCQGRGDQKCGCSKQGSSGKAFLPSAFF